MSKFRHVYMYRYNNFLSVEVLLTRINVVKDINNEGYLYISSLV